MRLNACLLKFYKLRYGEIVIERCIANAMHDGGTANRMK